MQSANIYLRPLERQDLPLRVKWVNDPEIHQKLMFDYPLSLAKTEKWFNDTLSDSTKSNFTVLDKKNDVPIGMTGLIQIELRHQKAQFYITIGEKDYWGRHIADEVISLVLEYGFTELNLNKIYLYTLENNERARTVYERNGFQLEGVLRQHYYCVGKFQDLYLHSMLKQDWENQL